ncbi:MAG: TonB-dependent receptor [Bacteroidetes bacterium]|nr:MAG: TonB-dependent receptor [Bacteroidota bacterium]
MSTFARRTLAQETVTISGTVAEAKSGETLPHANVRLIGTTLGAATNIEGHFVIVGVPVGVQTIKVSYLGFLTVEMEIDTEELTGPLLIELIAATDELDEILVTSETYSIMKTAEHVSRITISPKDLSVLPNIGGVDIFRALQLLPGISGTNEGSSGLFVRGGTPDQNLVLLDGMTVYHVDHFFGFFSAFNADAIKDVQVYKGAFPAKYGGRTSSVIDLAGKTGDVNHLAVGAGLNLLSTNAVVEIPLGGRGSFLLSARRSYTDIIQSGLYTSIYELVTGEDITSEDESQDGLGGGAGQGGGRRGGGGALGAGFRNPQEAFVQPDFYFYDLNGKLTFRPSDVDVLSLSFYNGQDHLDKSRDQSRAVTAGGQNSANVFNSLFDLTEWGNIGFSGKWSRQWNPRFFSNALVAYSRYFSEFDRNTFLERTDAVTDTVLFARNFGTIENNEVNDFSFRLDNEWQISQRNELGFGIQLTRMDITYDFVRDDTLSILTRDDEALQAALYAQNSWRPSSRVNVTAGIRSVYYDQSEKLYFEPRLSVGIGLTDRISIKGGFGRYNQFVARVVNENVTEGARDFWLLADGNSVGVSGSTHYVLGASYETADWLFDAETYYKDITDLTEFSLRFQRAPTIGRGGFGIEADELFFTGDGIARGLEFLVQKKRGRYSGWLSYTLSEIEHTFPGLNDGEPFPALHDQRHELKLVNSLNMGRWTLSGTWMFSTGKPYTSPESQYVLTLLDGSEQTYIHVGGKNSERLPAYHRLDVALHYTMDVKTSRVDFGFSIFNLYNRTNVWYKEFDLSESPMVTTDVSFLGITPNLSVRVDL